MTAAEVTSPGFPHSTNGARIRRARKLTGLSQEAFAPIIGTTRRHMIRLENGQHLPSGELRDRIVKATGTEEQIEAADDEEEADYVTVLFTRAREIALKRLMPLAIVALVFASTAQASLPALPQMVSPAVLAATDAAGKPITMIVNPAAPGSGSSYAGSDEIVLGTTVYQSAARGGSYGLFVLLHEVGHATGIVSEHQADCFALHHFKRALGFFHLSPQQARWRWRDARQINAESLAYHQGYGCA